MPYTNVEMCTVMMKTLFDSLVFDYKCKRMVTSKSMSKFLEKVFQNDQITVEAYKCIIH